MTDLRIRAIQLYDAFTHEHRDRRTLLKQMAVLAGSVAAAEALIAGIAASPAAASITKPDDRRLRTSSGAFPLDRGKLLRAYFAAPVKGTARTRASVVVIHENRGLNAHIEDVARRLALEGFSVVAPDLLSDQGGTPADEDRARDMIAKADTDALIAETVGMIEGLKRGESNGKVGIVGFCWGGGMVDRVAIAAGASLDAAVAYYGPAPDPSEAVKVQAPMLLHYAGLDTRVDATGAPWVAALKAAGKQVTAYTYPGVNHAFNNDTSADRYAPEAAKLAWGRTVDFFHKHLG